MYIRIYNTIILFTYTFKHITLCPPAPGGARGGEELLPAVGGAGTGIYTYNFLYYIYI